MGKRAIQLELFELDKLSKLVRNGKLTPMW